MTIKHSKIRTSNGHIYFNYLHKYETDFDYYTKLRIYSVTGRYRIYLNESEDYITLNSNEELNLNDFMLMNLKIVNISNLMGDQLQWYACK